LRWKRRDELCFDHRQAEPFGNRIRQQVYHAVADQQIRIGCGRDTLLRPVSSQGPQALTERAGHGEGR
jgi:hypothetical protein